jgi:hypothetical protein
LGGITDMKIEGSLFLIPEEELGEKSRWTGERDYGNTQHDWKLNWLNKLGISDILQFILEIRNFLTFIGILTLTFIIFYILLRCNIIFRTFKLLSTKIFFLCLSLTVIPPGMFMHESPSLHPPAESSIHAHATINAKEANINGRIFLFWISRRPSEKLSDKRLKLNSTENWKMMIRKNQRMIEENVVGLVDVIDKLVEGLPVSAEILLKTRKRKMLIDGFELLLKEENVKLCTFSGREIEYGSFTEKTAKEHICIRCIRNKISCYS